MKTTCFYFSTILVLVLFSCSENENGSCNVRIRLTLPEGADTLPLDKMKVVLTNKDQGNTYSANCSSEGIAELNVEYGYYTASVHYQTASGQIFSGRLESLSLVPGQEEATASIQLSRSQTNALVIKEIYYGGCQTVYETGYQADQYITLCNNSEETIYLDRLCIAVVDPATSLQSPWMQHTDMARIPVNDLAWQFPGSGNEYPLEPGAETTIATNAVDHTNVEYEQPNSIDLSKVDWGFWDVSLSKQNITPGVKPMHLVSRLNPNVKLYSFSPQGPTLMLFGIEGTTAEVYVNDPANREDRPNSSNKKCLMIPKEWVIDCVECVENASHTTFKRVPGELDNGAFFIPNNPYTGNSIIRKSTTSPTGQLVYQDTNNSTDDMIVSTPSLKK